MSEYSTALKVGTTLLVLDLLEKGLVPRFELSDPVRAFRALSRDPSRAWVVPLSQGGSIPALDIQWACLEQARRVAAGYGEEVDWVLAGWEGVLVQLGGDQEGLVGRCDWATKKWLLDEFVQAEGLDWEDPEDRSWLQSQDLEYHNIDPERGLYLLLETQGQVARLTREEEVVRAAVVPPQGTRAHFRGRCLEKFGGAIRSLNWDSIEFNLDGRIQVVDLKSCVEAGIAARYNRIADQARTVEELVRQLEAAKAEGDPISSQRGG